MAEIYGAPFDPMSYSQVLVKYGSRRNLEAHAASGDPEAKLWRGSPGLMNLISSAPQRAPQKLATLATLGA